MSERRSRIPHPPGGRFVILHDWLVREVGRDAAAVFGVVEFLDRVEPRAGCPVASRARIIADLQGFVGRNGVDKALHDFMKRGWFERHERTAIGTSNLQTWHEYSLNAAAVSEFLAGTSGLPEQGSPGSLNRDAGFPKTGTEAGPELGNRCTQEEVERESRASSLFFTDKDKEARDTEFAWRLGCEGNLSDEEIRAACNSVRHPSQFESAVRDALRKKQSEANRAQLDALRVAPEGVGKISAPDVYKSKLSVLR